MTNPLDSAANGASRDANAARLVRRILRVVDDARTADSVTRRRLISLAIYTICLTVYALFARERLWGHTNANHYALLAESWLRGRHDLGGPPPAYAGGDDFGLYQGKWYITFPPLPAIIIAPLVWASGDASNFRDGQFFVWLAGIGPAVIFLVLEKLRRTSRSTRSEGDNVRLALLFAFGTVYFFCAVQGSVWYATHVVSVAAMAVFVLAALDAERPALAGAMCGCLFLTRPLTLLVCVFFFFEALRAVAKTTGNAPTDVQEQTVRGYAKHADTRKLAAILAQFSLPLVAFLAFASWYNSARFHDPRPWAFGHEYLQVGWQARIKAYGLFSYHFVSRNLAVMLAGLPWTTPSRGGGPWLSPPFRINGNGLALWFTSPIYLWLLWPRRVSYVSVAATLAAAGPLVANLFYQNSGWFQFGYRFSNDYAVFLVVLLALGGQRMGRLFWLAAVWSVACNTFGAYTFRRYETYYASEPDRVYPPD